MKSYGEGPNAEAIEAWNTVLFEKFCRFEHLVTNGLGIHGRAALERHPPAPGASALDVGCGLGDTTRALARAVGPRGSAHGVDAAARFIDRARDDARREGVENAKFSVADVQTADLGQGYGLAFSRFGTMFFANPVQALKNVRRSLAPEGRLCMVVWRKREDNEWLYSAETIVKQLVEVPEEHDAPTCGPGPFSLAGADMTSDILRAAGYRGVTFERHDAPICIGRDLDDAVDFAMTLGPAGEAMRLGGEAAERKRPEVTAALRDTLSRFVTPDGVWADSSTWIVTALAS